MSELRRRAGRIFLGRYSRGAWVLATLAFIALLTLAAVPSMTFLWTSPAPLRDIYVMYLAALLAVVVLGLLLALAKRLHDQNINGLWAIPILIALPWGLLSGAQRWSELAYEKRPHADTSYYLNVALLVWLAVVIVFGVRSPRAAGARFGDRIDARDLVRLTHPLAALGVFVATALIGVSIYAGFFQQGLWVRRSEYSFYSGPAVSVPGGGRVIATCGNARGVSAAAQKDSDTGFFRDAVGGTWALVVLPDGTLDIQTFSDSQVLSYQDDGFAITSTPLKFTPYGSLTADIDHFQVVAQGSANVTGDVQTVTVMSFEREEYGFKALISSTRALGKGGIFTAKHPRASGFLMMADCRVSQEYKAADERQRD